MTTKHWQYAALISAGLMLSTSGAWAAASKLPETTIQYDSVQNAKISAVEIKPAGAGKHPAIILVHDKDGITDGMKEIAQSFAAAGYFVMMPDFASRPMPQKKVAGNQPMDQMMGMKTKTSGLNVAKTVADIDAAYDALAKDPNVDASKISSVGIGWGGWRTFHLAADKAGLYKAVVFYGVTPDDGSVMNIKAPVLGHYPKGEFSTTPASFKTAQWLGTKYTSYIYEDTFPGFFGGGSGNVDFAAAVGEGGVEEAAAQIADQQKSKVADKGPESKKLAMERTLAFLK